MIDLMDQQCSYCQRGTFNETTIYDDMDGVLHCTECNVCVSRYINVDDTGEQNEYRRK